VLTVACSNRRLRAGYPLRSTRRRNPQMVSPSHILFLCATESLSCEIVRFSQKKYIKRRSTSKDVLFSCIKLSVKTAFGTNPEGCFGKYVF